MIDWLGVMHKKAKQGVAAASDFLWCLGHGNRAIHVTGSRDDSNGGRGIVQEDSEENRELVVVPGTVASPTLHRVGSGRRGNAGRDGVGSGNQDGDIELPAYEPALPPPVYCTK